MTYKIKRYSPSALAIAFLLCSLPIANAQAPATPAAVTSAPGETATVVRTVDQYRIGPRDVLSIRVSAGRLVAELSMDSVEVDECGRIPLPSVEHEAQNEIDAAGKTRTELAEELRTFYKKYKKNPQVVVMVKEYNSQPVAINGAIIKPGQFQLRRPVRLLELVQFYAGGLTEKAGGRIQLARMSFNPCTAPVDASNGVEFVVLNLRDTLSGDEKANPFLRPGDVITVPEAKEAYVIGNVLHPGAILLKDDNVTLSQAIAMAGGTAQDSKRDKILIVRQDPGTTTRRDMTVNLEAIEKRQEPDVPLLPNDIVTVGVSGGKRLLRSIFGTIVPSIGNLPVQVIR